MSRASDLFTPGARAALRACSRDGAVLRGSIGLTWAKKLVAMDLAEGEDGMIALTEPGKIAWTLLGEIEALTKKKAQLIQMIHDGPPKPPARQRDEPPPQPDKLGALKSRGMTCGTTNTDSFVDFVSRLPPDPSTHRPRRHGPAAEDQPSAPGE